MYAVTAEQMRELDRKAIETCGMSGLVLMENAGRAVADVVRGECGSLRGKKVLILCGSGNNGGDGYVIARLLASEAKSVAVRYIAEPKTQDSIHNFEILTRYNQSAPASFAALSVFEWDSAEFQVPNLDDPDVVIDALTGTGLSTDLTSKIADIVEWINRLKKSVVISVDVPTGIDSTTGRLCKIAVKATHTVTFGFPKLGLYLPPATETVGKIHLSDIGFPWEPLAVRERFDKVEVLNEPLPKEWRSSFQPRKRESNKGDFGRVAILAGSRGMVGAAALTARAAQKIGAGLVTVMTCESAQSILAIKLDEQMTIPLPEKNGAVSLDAFEQIIEFAKRATCFCIGPGLTTSDETVLLVQRLLKELDLPIVLDADGLNALATEPTIAKARFERTNSALILTPHPGEAARLLNCSTAEIQQDRISSVRQIAINYNATVLLKGRHSLIADSEGRILINTTGNPGMAAGGMGDALTGIIGGLLAIELKRNSKSAWVGAEAVDLSALHIVGLGAYLHGVAGDLAVEGRSEAGLSASELIEKLPFARTKIQDLGFKTNDIEI